MILPGFEKVLEGGQGMSTSLLYHVLNIVGYRHRKTEYVGREIRMTIETNDKGLQRRWH